MDSGGRLKANYQQTVLMRPKKTLLKLLAGHSPDRSRGFWNYHSKTLEGESRMGEM
jgi:hypothetical protein